MTKISINRLSLLALAALVPVIAHPAAKPAATAPGAAGAASCTVASPSSPAVNVRDHPYSARGDGIHDDTQAIQNAIDAIAGSGGIVLIPPGTYLVNPVHVPSQGGYGVKLGSNMTLLMESGATLKAQPTSAGHYAVVAIYDANNVMLTGGGVIAGERANHLGTDGEWGMGVSIAGSSDVRVQNITSRDNWGDGFYIGRALNQNISFCGVISTGNRRQGMSIGNVTDIFIDHSEFSNTRGTAPELGIDIEPNANQSVTRARITNSLFANNAGGGFQSGVPHRHSDTASAHDILFENNIVSKNGLNPLMEPTRPAIEISNASSTQIKNNIITDNIGFGIRIIDNATGTIVKGNKIQGTRAVAGQRNRLSGTGIFVVDAPGSLIANNTITENDRDGIFIIPETVQKTLMTDNILIGNKKYAKF